VIALVLALSLETAHVQVDQGAASPAPASPAAPAPPAPAAPVAPPAQPPVAAPAPPATAPSATGPLQVIPRESFSWKTDALGQVIGETIACPPMPGRIKSIAPAQPLPEPLAAKQTPTSLRISGTASNGLTRDIAVLQWVGPVITWKRMPVPASAFEPALNTLAAWMLTHFFAVTLDDGSVVRVGTQPQQLSLTLGTASANAVTAQIADVPKGVTLAVPGAVPMPADGTMGAGPFLFEMARSALAIRIATYPDTILDIEVTDMPAQVRVSAMTPAGMELERALEEIAVTDEILKDAPDDQRTILSAQRAAQQSAVDELRKKASGERIRPTDEPISACIMDPVSGREYITMKIAVRDGAPQGGGARGGDVAADRANGSAREGSRIAPPPRKPPSGGWGVP
jgi:hypothetical protein